MSAALASDEPGPAELCGEPSERELYEVFGKLSSGKASGPDEITYDELSAGLHVIKDSLLGIFKLFWQTEMVPAQLRQLIICPLVKDMEGDVHDPANFRPIALLNSIFKIYERILKERVQKFLENKGVSPSADGRKLMDQQNGFRNGRSTIDPLFLIMEIVEEYRLGSHPQHGEYGVKVTAPKMNSLRRPLYFCFLDKEML